MRVIGSFAVLLALAGCATGPDLQSRMAAYVGAPEATLVQSLGVPDRQVTVGETKFFAYQLRYQMQTSGSTAFWGGNYWGGYRGWGGYPGWGGFYNNGPQNINVWSCVVTFMLEHQKVYSFMLQGNDCR